MELAKITAKGQVTLPTTVRRRLNLTDGDKVAFIEKDGQYMIVNPTVLAFENVQQAFNGEAERLGICDVDDVVEMIKGIRAERRTQNENNA
jgi:AbrB family looped-hinge helix DNA binding protein